MNQGVCVKCGEPIEEAGGTYLNGEPIPEKEFRRTCDPPKGYLCFDCKLDARPKPETPTTTDLPSFKDLIKWNNEQSHKRDETEENYG